MGTTLFGESSIWVTFWPSLDKKNYAFGQILTDVNDQIMK